MEQTLKITNVLSDPTRFHIYNYITTNHEEVTVQEIANNFNIHPNVARLHLSKLEDVDMLVSETRKTGRGGRPSRLYRLSDEVIKLNFPFRDYELLATITLETLVQLGDIGTKTLNEIAKQFGTRAIKQSLSRDIITKELSVEEKKDILEQLAMKAGFYPEINVVNDEQIVKLQIYNCPFNEIAEDYQEVVCNMHKNYLEGMFSVLFGKIEMSSESNLLTGCDSCLYKAVIE